MAKLRPDKSAKAARKRAYKAKDFPRNTCPASRHVQMLADALYEGKPYPMLTEEPRHVAGSLYSTIASLWESRTAFGWPPDGDAKQSSTAAGDAVPGKDHA